MISTATCQDFNIEIALAQAWAWQRYRYHRNSALKDNPGSPYIRAVCDHATRIQRLSEGLTAFATTGVQDEVFWLMRPCYELFASQCLLQFGDVRNRAGAFMTGDERAEAYWAHMKSCYLRLLVSHPNFSGHTTPRADRDAARVRLENELQSSPYQLNHERPWHNMRLRDAVKTAVRTTSTFFADAPLKELSDDSFEIRVDYCNFGVHGNSFSSRFLHVEVDPGDYVISDARTPDDPSWWLLATNLAIRSLQMLAEEFNQRPLVKALLEQGYQEARANPNRLVPHFPTATLLPELATVQ